MSANKFKGTGVALITPFTKEKRIDFKALENLVEHVISNGVDFLVALGTTAETPTLSEAENMDVLINVIEKNNGRLPVVCGIGGNHTDDVIRKMEKYPLDRVDAILSVSPYYNKPSQSGIVAHFKALDKHTPKPIILYNVPGRTGSNMLSSTTLQLANECENIIAIKEASGNMKQCMELVQHRPKGFTLLSGDDDLVMAQIAVGFDGVISVAANCFTADFCEMVNSSLRHAFTHAQKLHYKLLDGIDLLFAEGNPAGVKCVLSEMGMCENEMRLPVVPVSSATHEKIKAYLQR
ncbi:MAG: 4-hydroxy-tetrahydrodipicolinate synthase [Chitinophagaceae bacterium]|nr:4-hydroxy-tetrahydrodipicolinate synthase [Chitinophagaceae bacterium]